MHMNTGDIDSSRRNKSKRKSKKTPGGEEPSLISFGNDSGERTKRRKSFNPVVITDALTDVRQRYHINPKA